jgi:hypothetical protein
MLRLAAIIAIPNASPEFVAHVEKCYGFPRGTDLQIYRPFRSTRKRYLKTLGSEQSGKYCIARAKLSFRF